MTANSFIKRISFALTVILICSILGQGVMADTYTTLTVKYEASQDAARSVFTQINKWRQSGNAWYWDVSTGTKHNCGKLNAFAYDYNLEQVAIQRALEAVIQYNHTRPDGTAHSTCNYNGTRPYGENLLYNNETADEAFYAWQENIDSCVDQPHRQLMLSTKYTCIGIGHVVYNGKHFWALETGKSNSGASATTALNCTRTGTIKVNNSNLKKDLHFEDGNCSITYDQVKELSGVKAYYCTSASVIDGIPATGTISNLKYTSDDPSSIEIVNNNQIHAISMNDTTIRCTAVVNGETFSGSQKYYISPRSVSSSDFVVTVPECTYNGSAQRPKPVVTYKGEVLVAGTDYSISDYKNNINAGSAQFSIWGKGRFNGTLKVSFRIQPLPISNYTIAAMPDVEYTGAYIKPDVIITYDGKTFDQGTDYYLSYSDNRNVGTAIVTINSRGNYKFTDEATFTITPMPISKVTVETIGDMNYTGQQIKPLPVVKNGTTTLKNGTDYSLSYSNNVNTGTATVTITGKGNYKGTRTETFRIVQGQADSLTLTVNDAYYTGAPVIPSYSVRSGTVTLTEGTDYKVTLSNNTNIGTAKITVTCIGSFTGSVEKNFEIKPIPASLLTCILDSSSYVYTGSPIVPEVTLSYGSLVLKKDTDYSLSFSNNTEVGNAVITIKGKGICTGTATKSFSIVGKNIGNVKVDTIPAQIYTGSSIEPAVTVRDGDNVLVVGKDYDVSYSSNIEPGTAAVTIWGSGHYGGYKQVRFSIKGIPVSSVSVNSIAPQTYTGSEIKPSVTIKYNGKVLIEGTDYSLYYYNNIAVGTGKIQISGISHYSGTLTVEFAIVGTEFSSASISSIADQQFTGSAIKPAVTVKYGSKTLVSGTDYTVSYSDNVNVGTATVIVTGKGSYSGTKSATFKIVPNPATPTITLLYAQSYTGSELKPSFTVKCGNIKLTEGTDYTVKYSNNIKVGTATVTVTCKGNYSGTTAATFKINPRSVGNVSIAPIPDQKYTGKQIKPSVVVTDGSKTLIEGTDYTLFFDNDTDVGTATAVVEGTGNYQGQTFASFKIVANDSVTIASIPAQTYTGSAIKPSVTVTSGSNTLVAGTDYAVSYSNNVNAGTAKVTITCKGGYSGSATATFSIAAKSISSVTVSSIPDQLYTGSAVKPAVTAIDGSKTLVSGTDYTVSYINNTAVGTATVTVKGKGNYKGTKKINFNIIDEVITYEWMQSGSKWFYVGSNGVNATGFWNIDGKTYYFNNSGVMLTKWQEIGGSWYYFASSGEIKTGWQKISKVWYYFDASGKMATGLKKIDGVNYYFKDSGAMGTGWIQVGDSWYYYASSGEGKTGWQQISKVWYYFDEDSRMAVGFREIKGKTYFFKDSGAMVAKKWIQDGEDWYWFKSDGSMAVSETVKISGKAYNFDDNGVCLNP